MNRILKNSLYALTFAGLTTVSGCASLLKAANTANGIAAKTQAGVQKAQNAINKAQATANQVADTVNDVKEGVADMVKTGRDVVAQAKMAGSDPAGALTGVLASVGTPKKTAAPGGRREALLETTSQEEPGPAPTRPGGVKIFIVVESDMKRVEESLTSVLGPLSALTEISPDSIKSLKRHAHHQK